MSSLPKSLKTVADSYRTMNLITESEAFKPGNTVRHHLAGTIHHLDKADELDGSARQEHVRLAAAHANTASTFADSTEDHAAAAHAHGLMRDHFTNLANWSKGSSPNSSYKLAADHHSKQAQIHNDYGN